MKQDIQILEEYINFKKQFTLLDDEQERLEALEHLIKAYKELEELYKSEKKMKNQYVELYQDVLLKENVIPVSLVEEKIEELNEYYKKEIYPSLISWSDVDITEYYDGMIGILQELLERRK